MTRRLLVNAVHLTVLSSFALAQPLLDLLGRTPEFFVVRGSTAADVVVFALAVIVAVPLACILVEGLASLVSPRALSGVHLTIVAVLAAAVALQIVRKEVTATVPACILAAVAGGAFAMAYARASAVRLFVTVLAPAPLIFLALFLDRVPLGDLQSSAKALSVPAPRNPVPVVWVVFDEFAEASIMNASQHVDAARFPSFAALAATSIWYRNATSVHEHTPDAVPAILTGQDPRTGALPVAQDHPDSVFTLLGRTYRMNAYESVTQLCPQNLCRRRRQSFVDRMRSLGDDLEVVYGHLILPKKLEARLPSVTATWQGFAAAEHDDSAALSRTNLAVGNARDVGRAIGRQMWQDQRFIWDQWVSSIAPERRPTLHLMHLLMPHYPWRYLPDGKQYANSLGIDGLGTDSDTWTTDPWVVEQNWQRHLLQVGFTDRMLGDLVARLKDQGIWQRALVVVTADHGVSFVPGDHRRSVTTRNFSDIAAVPLFVKLPNEHRGRIDDRSAETVDILPTVARVLGLKVPYHVDGRPLLGPTGPSRSVVVRRAGGSTVEKTLAATVAGRERTLARQLSLFGSGNWGRVFAIGSNRTLIGRAAGSLHVVAGQGRVSLDGESLLDDVDPSSPLSPAHVTGRVTGLPSRTELVIAVNGTIAAATRTFSVAGTERFAAFVSGGRFKPGRNAVGVYAVRGGTTLTELRGGTDGDSRYRLTDGSIVDPSHRTLTVRANALGGRVEDWYVENGSVRFGGWAGDVEHHALVDEVVVFQGSRFLYAGATTVARSLPQLHAGGEVQAGFVFELPRQLVGAPGAGRPPLRFYAVRGDIASELPTAPGFPWG